VAAVQQELLELADLLERAHDPDASAVQLVRHLLTDGCESPLYNRAVHASELKATLFYAKKGLDGCTPPAGGPAGAAHSFSPSRPPDRGRRLRGRNRRTAGGYPP
jgi:hypothetical protein